MESILLKVDFYNTDMFFLFFVLFWYLITFFVFVFDEMVGDGMHRTTDSWSWIIGEIGQSMLDGIGVSQRQKRFSKS